MNRVTLNRLYAIVTILAFSFLSAPGHAATDPLVTRLPGGANAVMVLNVEKLLQSPVGKDLGLQSKLLSGFADRPLGVPATAKRVAIGALVQLVGMESIWQAAVIDLPHPPRLEPVLRAQGGYLDQIDGKQAACTARNTFFVVLDDHTLGVLMPGQRQRLTQWISAKPDSKALSPYISAAIAGGADTVCVFAVDMDEVVSVTALMHAASQGQFPSLEKADQKLLTALASVTGMTMNVRATSRLDAEWTIDFKQDVSALGKQTKAFVMDVLTAAELYEPDMDQWEFTVDGKRIIGKRVAEMSGLNRLLALLSPAQLNDAVGASGSSPAPATAKAPATPPENQAAPANPAAAASQKYYQAVAKSLDSISSKPSPRQGANWLVAQARIIKQLPILNVDPALIAWGNLVCEAFTRAAQELAVGQERSKVAAAGVASPTSYTTYSENGYSATATAETRAAYRNASQQRTQAAQAERVAAAARAFDIFNIVIPERGKIRVEMTQKYGVEF